jgi:hypothetical protein
VDISVLYDKRIPLEVRNLARERLTGKSLIPQSEKQRELHALALLLAIQANPELALFEGEKALLYATGKNFDPEEIDIARGRFNSRKKPRSRRG